MYTPQKLTSREKYILFQKYFQGSCSRAEEEQVKGLLQQADEDEELNRILDEAWEERALIPDIKPQESEKLYRRISRKLGFRGKSLPAPERWVNSFRQTGWRIAAAVAFLVLLAGFGYRLQRQKTAVEGLSTGFGQMATVILPDSSTIILNGNSSIQYQRWWNGDHPREVWLDGEGFFSVRPTSDRQKFIVHTADGVVIEVLGTSFTATSRKRGTRVVLNEGKVRLNLAKTRNPSSVSLLPGDLVEVSPNQEEVKKERVNPSDYSAWIDKTLVFRNTSLGEIARLLEETYGLQVTVADSSLLQKRVSGSTPISPQLDLLFIGLEQMFELTISRKNNEVLIHR